MKDCLGQAVLAQKLNLPIPAEQAATGLHALVSGMIQNRLLDTTAYKLRQSGEIAIDVYPEVLALGLPSRQTQRHPPRRPQLATAQPAQSNCWVLRVAAGTKNRMNRVRPQKLRALT